MAKQLAEKAEAGKLAAEKAEADKKAAEEAEAAKAAEDAALRLSKIARSVAGYIQSEVEKMVKLIKSKS